MNLMNLMQYATPFEMQFWVKMMATGPGNGVQALRGYIDNLKSKTE